MAPVIKSPAIAAESIQLLFGSLSSSLPITPDFQTEVADIDSPSRHEPLLSNEAPALADNSSSKAGPDDKDGAAVDQHAFERFFSMHRDTLQELEQKASQEGYAQGFSEGESAAKLKYAEAISRFERLAEAGQDSIAAIFQKSEALMGAIVFEAVCKIIGEHLQSADGCRHVVSQVIKDTADGDILTIKVSPKDFAWLQNLDRDTDETTGIDMQRLASLPVKADNAVELGGCMVELKEGSLDGRIETQFRMFAQSIKDALGRR